MRPNRHAKSHASSRWMSMAFLPGLSTWSFFSVLPPLLLCLFVNAQLLHTVPELLLPIKWGAERKRNWKTCFQLTFLWAQLVMIWQKRRKKNRKKHDRIHRPFSETMGEWVFPCRSRTRAACVRMVIKLWKKHHHGCGGAMEKWKLIFISEPLSWWMETDDNLWCGPCTEFGVTDIGSKLNAGEILLFLHYGFLHSWAFFLQWFFVSDPFD